MKNNLNQILIGSLIVKGILALFIPLTLDEYYYFLWGQNLSLSYFDHPPIVGWLMLLSQPLVNLSEGAMRWPFLLMSHGTLIVWLKILKDRLTENRLRQFLWIALLNPLWGMGVFIATPDIPLLFFWSLALYFCQNILTKDNGTSYLGLAIALGLGFLSKYQVALFLPCLLLLLWQQKQLYKLFKPKAIGAIVLALAVCSPVFIWNYQHDWVSIDFQWKHGMASKYWKWNLPLEYFFTQLFIIFPTFLLFFFQKERPWTKDWLLAFAGFPFLFFLYSSFKGRVEGNWVIMALPAVYALSALYSSEKNWLWARRTIGLWSLVFCVALGMVAFRDQLPPNKIKLFEAQKFSNLIEKVDTTKNNFAFSYQLASFLTFKTGKMTCKLQGYGRPDHFQFWLPCQDLGEEFYYFTEKSDRRNWSEDFPDYQQAEDIIIDEDYKIIRVVKK